MTFRRVGRFSIPFTFAEGGIPLFIDAVHLARTEADAARQGRERQKDIYSIFVCRREFLYLLSAPVEL